MSLFLADVWFYGTEGACFESKKIHFESEKVALKNSIWEGELLVLWLPISFYGDSHTLLLQRTILRKKIPKLLPQYCQGIPPFHDLK